MTVIDAVLCFSTDATTRTGRNLTAKPRLAVHLESGDEVLVLEDAVAVLRDPDPALAQAIDDAFAGKYDWHPSTEQTEPVGEGWFVVRPRVAIAWTSCPKDATRWSFPAV